MNFPGYDDDDVNVSLVSAHYWRRIKLKEDLVVAFEVDEDVLRRTVMFASRQRFSIAQWHWESPAEIYRRKKDIVHAIRYLLFAHQILLHGKARPTSFEITDYSAANEYYHRIMAEPNVKAQVDFEYYRNEKERIAKAFKATMVLKYFHTKCETVIHNLKHTLGSRENYIDYFSHPKNAGRAPFHFTAAESRTTAATATMSDIMPSGDLGEGEKPTGEMIFTDFVKKVNEMFGEAVEGFRVLDDEDAALTQYLQEDLAKQQEKGRQLRAQIEKAQYSIKQFMRALPTSPVIEE
ncbi:uncharacterized protein ACA1_227100 [Acanthamoeba castellanii str. Neff]|uniref:Uncharacterized protein n=2 Tax=Acanthamoeba castellanii (strain ATCC 30010 / Neff) TaxID=1257118 RepID=L8H8Q9_ACACF|nr:uncharacterized protein ACA1_227100 [Acanthamoeba castellanii str. Neff]ELR21560.1 hypothetical protein ACA1_227100 [Acanthamoeba castellanii str. Neff]